MVFQRVVKPWLNGLTTLVQGRRIELTVKRPRNTIPWVFGVVGLAFIALSACQKDSWGGGQVPEAGFVDLVAQLKLATAQCGDDLEKANEARRVILKQHAVSPETFHRHYSYLMEHPDSWRGFHAQVVERLKYYQEKAKGEPNGH